MSVGMDPKAPEQPRDPYKVWAELAATADVSPVTGRPRRSDRRPNRGWHLGMSLWLVYLLFAFFDALTGGGPAGRVAAEAGLVLAFIAGYVYLIWRRPHEPPLPGRLVVLGAMAAVSLVLILEFGPPYILLLLFLNVGVSIALPAGPSAVRVAAVVVVAAAALSVHAHLPGEEIALNAFQTAIGAFATIGFRYIVGLNAKLRLAREDLARMAVTEERLRFARDLHDLLGHSLSLIVLKSDLAEQLVDADPGQARHELRELRQVARRSLAEVREAVGGYRQVAVAAEVAGARAALDSAGIEATIEALPGGLPDKVEAVLGWAVREGVTNVLRHSGANRCRVSFERTRDAVVCEIADDGRGGKARADGGSGLAGLGERVAALDGSLEAGPRPEGPVFRLRVELPLGDRS
jgi:two-component system sensor histidine kinase DesK